MKVWNSALMFPGFVLLLATNLTRATAAPPRPTRRSLVSLMLPLSQHSTARGMTPAESLMVCGSLMVSGTSHDIDTNLYLGFKNHEPTR